MSVTTTHVRTIAVMRVMTTTNAEVVVVAATMIVLLVIMTGATVTTSVDIHLATTATNGAMMIVATKLPG